MTLGDRPRACAEFEFRIVDATVDGLDPKTRRHLEVCAPCARLAAEYLGVAEFGRRVLPTLPFSPVSRLRRTVSLAAIAAAIVLAVTAASLRRFSGGDADPAKLTVLPQADAVVERIDDRLARIRAGESTFVLTDPGSSVETPFGTLNCPSNCEFTVRLEDDACGWVLPASLDPAGQLGPTRVRMAIAVASGEVVSHQNGRSDILGASHRLTLPFDHYR